MIGSKSLFRLELSLSVAALLGACSLTAQAATLQVGPGKQYASLNAVQTLVKPGDLVEVYGDTTYPGDVWFKVAASADKPITIRGIPVNGKRPVLSGGAEWTVLFAGDFYTFEGFDVTGGTSYCVVNKAHGTTIRDSVVHDCPRHGILGTDSESGSITIEYCEVYHCGSAEKYHQLYIATDETLHPKSVFRLQHCYIHDSLGGNNVKTRAERNEIYYNWIEGAVFHELDLIGPDGQDANLAREDSDVVGNVIIKNSEWQLARIGGDGTGATFGRYRFVNNTFVLADISKTGLRMQYELESLELHNNVFYRRGAGNTTFIKRSDPAGQEPAVFGTNNWIQNGFVEIPVQVGSSAIDVEPGFFQSGNFDFRPTQGSPLVDTGTDTTSTAGPHQFPNPLIGPLYLPPSRRHLASNSAVLRPVSGTVDVGAYELGSPLDPGTGGSGGSAGSSGSSGGAGVGNAGQAGSQIADGGTVRTDATASESGCSCHTGARTSAPSLALLALGLFGLFCRKILARA